MTATELIARLQGLVALHGDVRVITHDGNRYGVEYEAVWDEDVCQIVLDETANGEDK